MSGIDDETLEKIAVYMRENMKVKSRQLGARGKMAAYFSGKRMLDFMMESKFSTEQDEEAPITSRQDAIEICKKLMQRKNASGEGYFFRGEFGEKKVKKAGTGEIKTKKFVKPMQGGYHPQFFVDEDVPFVWTYDPVTRTTLMYGLMLLGGVAACAALPLWPMWLRNIVVAFLLFILVGRPGIWLVVWLATFSRWNFYILPNLDEDISFEKRFKPLISFERSETASGGDDDGDDDGDDGDDGDDEGDDGEEGDGDGDGDEDGDEDGES